MSSLGLFDKLQSGYYTTNNYEYVSRAQALRDPALARQKELYEADMQRRLDEFKADALEKAGLTGHPKADKVYHKAWEMGHSSGLHEVAHYLMDLAELVL